jgi:hypothetical protein
VASTPVNVNTATTTHLVSAPTAPGFIRVLGYLLLAAGSDTVTLQDTSAAALTGPFALTATTPQVEVFDGNGVFDLVPGRGLDLVTTAAVQVSGHVKYEIKGV